MTSFKLPSGMIRYGLSREGVETMGGYRLVHEESEGEGVQSSDEEVADLPRQGKKTKGRVKLKMEYIDNKLRRYTTFSKRKTGIMKKAYELSTLTGTQVMLLVASETGHVYTFATRKLQPIITSEAGKALIQTCLNSPDQHDEDTAGQPEEDQEDNRMSVCGFEETELSYNVPEHEEDDQREVSPTQHQEDDQREVTLTQHHEDDQREVSPPTQSEDNHPNNNPMSPPLMTIPPIVLAQLMKTGNHSTQNKITSAVRPRDDLVTGSPAVSIYSQENIQQGHNKKSLSPKNHTFSESVSFNLIHGNNRKYLSQSFISSQTLQSEVTSLSSSNQPVAGNSHYGLTSEIKQEPNEETDDSQMIRNMPNILKRNSKFFSTDDVQLKTPKQQNKQDDVSNTIQSTNRLAEMLKGENYKTLLTGMNPGNLLKRKLMLSSQNVLSGNAGESPEFNKNEIFSVKSTSTSEENLIRLAQAQNSLHREEIEDPSAIPQNLSMPKKYKY